MQPANPFRNNPLLKTATPGEDRPRRFPWAASVLFHVLFAIGLLVLPGRFAREAEPEPIDIVFYKPQVEPLVPPPEPPRPEPEPEPEPITIAEVQPEPAPVPEPVVPRAETPPPPRPRPEPIARVTPKPEPPKRSKPKIPPKPKTGMFSEPKPERRPAPKPARVVAKVGSFGDEPVEAPSKPEPRRNRVVAAGSFGGGSVEVPRESAPEPRSVVREASFAPAAAPRESPRKTKRTVVASAAFADDPPQEAEPSARGSRSISQGGFGAVENTQASRRNRSLPTDAPDTPVEIVSKPKPVYTYEAKKLRIEGEVVLEVTFGNSGELRVLRVLDGLGHGLDEAAIEAAKKVQFTPARRQGRPVDYTATLRVVFRLA